MCKLYLRHIVLWMLAQVSSLQVQNIQIDKLSSISSRFLQAFLQIVQKLQMTLQIKAIRMLWGFFGGGGGVILYTLCSDDQKLPVGLSLYFLLHHRALHNSMLLSRSSASKPNVRSVSISLLGFCSGHSGLLWNCFREIKSRFTVSSCFFLWTVLFCFVFLWRKANWKGKIDVHWDKKYVRVYMHFLMLSSFRGSL